MTLDTKLLQTRVPEKAFDAVTKLATEAGISVAAWLRQTVLQKIGMDGRGKRVKGGKRK